MYRELSEPPQVGSSDQLPMRQFFLLEPGPLAKAKAGTKRKGRRTRERTSSSLLDEHMDSTHLFVYAGYLPSGLWVQIEIDLYFQTHFVKGDMIGFRGVQDIIHHITDLQGCEPRLLSVEDNGEMRLLSYHAAVEFLDHLPNQNPRRINAPAP